MATMMEGKVFRVFTKNFEGKNLYSIKLDGIDGYIRMGEDRHAKVVEEGYTIKVKVAKDQRGNLKLEKVKLLEKGEPISNAKKGGAPRKGGGQANVDWDAKDQKIQMQSARRDAITYVLALLETDTLSFPKGATKTNKEARMAALDGFVDFYTVRFFEDVQDVNNFGAVSRNSGELDTDKEVAEDDFDEDVDTSTSNDDDDWD